MDQEAIGLLVCGGFQGTFVTKQAHDLIVKYKISTMILSRKNAHSVLQMSKLIRDLQYIALHEANYKYPLAFAIDEEGGMMNSLFDPEHLTQFPGAMALAATGDIDLVYEVLRALALELRQIGFSIILGPVLDVVTKMSHQLVSVRSFGTSVDEVVKYGRACAKGLRDGGLITVGKHFPGIGNARVDSLLELPMMTDSMDQIRRFNLIPFAELIKEGLLDGISAAGCGVPTISPDETHACLLPVILTRLLREEMGFEGFVISECLEMDALYHSIGLGQGVVLAIYAGCDLVMVCHDYNFQVEAIESIHTALNNGMLDEQIINACLKRLDRVRQKMPTWSQIFPPDYEAESLLFKNASPDAWTKHQQLAELAYRKSITLVRDYEAVLPLTQFAEKPGDCILVLTPLLKPIYPHSEHDDNIYPGEEVFKEFGKLLTSGGESASKFNVLHTTYTANGLTALHELLIKHSKAVIVVTSEALRHMYQIGIVKYISMLCGVTPHSLSSNERAQLSKPLVIVATLSPYDFFHNRNIGSAYLCCYDYTELALRELANVLMGRTTAQGCVPGEKKFILNKAKRRRSLSVMLSSPERSQIKIRKSTPPKRRWLVEDFELSRDWRGLLKLFKAGMRELSDDSHLRLLLSLLHVSANQKHFVVRNSSLNILYGVVMTWVDTDSDEQDPKKQKLGKIVYVLVDKAKRMQLIGKNLHTRAMRYLTEEQGCHTVQLGSLLPLLDLADGAFDTRVQSFFNSCGWGVSGLSALKLNHVMILKNVPEWSVPSKIFRELIMVGVRFDVCLQTDQLQKLLKSVPGDGLSRHTRELYRYAVEAIDSNSPHEAKVLIALEPTNQSVIGSIIIFTNNSLLARFYPFMSKAQRNGTLVGGVVSPVIDPAYLNLTDIFKYGLICSGVTYLRSNASDGVETQMNLCFMMDVADDKTFNSVQDIGFESWRSYREFYDKTEDASVHVSEE